MYERWSEYFFMIGSSAAALIGLMFVVVTLTAGRDRNELERGKKLYTTPIVWHLGAVLVLSGGAVAPVAGRLTLGSLSIAVAVAGMIYSSRIALGILRAKVAAGFSRYDSIWYGLVPAATYVAIGSAGVALIVGMSWAIAATAAALMVLLLVSIHNEWDLVTFLAPDAQPSQMPDHRGEPTSGK